MNRPMLLLVLLSSAAAPLCAQSPSFASRIPPRPAYADSIARAERASILFSIQEAEAEGARWVHRAEPTTQPVGHGAERWGNVEPRKCVAVTSTEAMRSGEFLVGGELGGAVSAREIKVWWEPMHPATSFALVVRGTRLSPAGDSVRYLNEGWAIGGSPATGAVGPVFYASGIRIPSPGRWLLVATSGPDWGCFVVDVR